jgi:hypothetical protein
VRNKAAKQGMTAWLLNLLQKASGWLQKKMAKRCFFSSLPPLPLGRFSTPGVHSHAWMASGLSPVQFPIKGVTPSTMSLQGVRGGQ